MIDRLIELYSRAEYQIALTEAEALLLKYPQHTVILLNVLGAQILLSVLPITL